MYFFRGQNLETVAEGMKCQWFAVKNVVSTVVKKIYFNI